MLWGKIYMWTTTPFSPRPRRRSWSCLTISHFRKLKWTSHNSCTHPTNPTGGGYKTCLTQWDSSSRLCCVQPRPFSKVLIVCVCVSCKTMPGDALTYRVHARAAPACAYQLVAAQYTSMINHWTENLERSAQADHEKTMRRTTFWPFDIRRDHFIVGRIMLGRPNAHLFQ